VVRDRFCALPLATALHNGRGVLEGRLGKGFSREVGQVLHHHLVLKEFLEEEICFILSSKLPLVKPAYSPGLHEKRLGAGMLWVSGRRGFTLACPQLFSKAFHCWALKLVAYPEDKLDILHKLRQLCIKANVGNGRDSNCELFLLHLANCLYFLH